ncbi:hypothetical protein D3C75_1268920 [compost metagenome]
MTTIDAAFITLLRAEVTALTEAVRTRREDLALYEARLAGAEWRLFAAEEYIRNH